PGSNSSSRRGRRSRARCNSRRRARSTSNTRSRTWARPCRRWAGINTERRASRRSPPPPNHQRNSGKPERGERQADIPAFALARAGAQVIHDEALAAAHLGQGLLHRADAAHLVGAERVALPARLALEPGEPIGLAFVAALDRSSLEIIGALARGHEAL